MEVLVTFLEDANDELTWWRKNPKIALLEFNNLLPPANHIIYIKKKDERRNTKEKEERRNTKEERRKSFNKLSPLSKHGHLKVKRGPGQWWNVVNW